MEDISELAYLTDDNRNLRANGPDSSKRNGRKDIIQRTAAKAKRHHQKEGAKELEEAKLNLDVLNQIHRMRQSQAPRGEAPRRVEHSKPEKKERQVKKPSKASDDSRKAMLQSLLSKIA
jgi:hypothetical protein